MHLFIIIFEILNKNYCMIKIIKKMKNKIMEIFLMNFNEYKLYTINNQSSKSDDVGEVN